MIVSHLVCKEPAGFNLSVPFCRAKRFQSPRCWLRENEIHPVTWTDRKSATAVPARRRGACVLIAGLMLATSSSAQDLSGPRVPSVSLSPVPVTRMRAGTSSQVELRFHVAPGFHVNSNTPKSEFLIPTVLKLDAPTDIVIGKIDYPQGQDLSFSFAPDEKLSVYSGLVALRVRILPLRDVIPAKYMIHGQLRYQACDKAACYPPKNLPVQFEINVAKAAAPPRPNPAQSPHIHK